MALLTVSINDPTLDKKSAEVAFALRALDEVKKELGKGNGTITSGTILSYTTGLGPTAMGTWTYTPSASNP
jgi:hypothetical protein